MMSTEIEAFIPALNVLDVWVFQSLLEFVCFAVVAFTVGDDDKVVKRMLVDADSSIVLNVSMTNVSAFSKGEDDQRARATSYPVDQGSGGRRQSIVLVGEK